MPRTIWALGGIGKTSENLAKAIEGETFEVDEMYPAYVEVVKLQNEKAAGRSATWAMEAEKIHFHSPLSRSFLSPQTLKQVRLCDMVVLGRAG